MLCGFHFFVFWLSFMVLYEVSYVIKGLSSRTPCSILYIFLHNSEETRIPHLFIR